MLLNFYDDLTIAIHYMFSIQTCENSKIGSGILVEKSQAFFHVYFLKKNYKPLLLLEKVSWWGSFEHRKKANMSHSLSDFALQTFYRFYGAKKKKT